MKSLVLVGRAGPRSAYDLAVFLNELCITLVVAFMDRGIEEEDRKD